MPDTERLKYLLEQAGEAHHAYEQEQLDGERDEEWPRWYAAFLLENGLATQIMPPPNQEKLADRLVAITEKHKAEASDQNWAGYAAQHLAEAYQ